MHYLLETNQSKTDMCMCAYTCLLDFYCMVFQVFQSYNNYTTFMVSI